MATKPKAKQKPSPLRKIEERLAELEKRVAELERAKARGAGDDPPPGDPGG